MIRRDNASSPLECCHTRDLQGKGLRGGTTWTRSATPPPLLPLIHHLRIFECDFVWDRPRTPASYSVTLVTLDVTESCFIQFPLSYYLSPLIVMGIPFLKCNNIYWVFLMPERLGYTFLSLRLPLFIIIEAGKESKQEVAKLNKICRHFLPINVTSHIDVSTKRMNFA